MLTERRAFTRTSLLTGTVTLALLLAVLRVRSGLGFGLVVLVAVFVPLERLFMLHPQPILRRR